MDKHLALFICNILSKNRKIVLGIVYFLSSSVLTLFFAACGGGTSGGSDSSLASDFLIDSRDGQKYKIVQIDEQWWMAENLNFETVNSFCFNDNPADCDKYGRFYTWAAAMDSLGLWGPNGKGCGYGVSCHPTESVRGVCPEGWHLPSNEDWSNLILAIGGYEVAGKLLKSTSGWTRDGNGSDEFSFAAYPAGGRGGAGNYNHEGFYAHFWSSTMGNIANAYNLELGFNSDRPYMACDHPGIGYSVRCIKD